MGPVAIASAIALSQLVQAANLLLLLFPGRVANRFKAEEQKGERERERGTSLEISRTNKNQRNSTRTRKTTERRYSLQRNKNSTQLLDATLNQTTRDNEGSWGNDRAQRRAHENRLRLIAFLLRAIVTRNCRARPSACTSFWGDLSWTHGILLVEVYNRRAIGKRGRMWQHRCCNDLSTGKRGVSR